MDPRRVPSHECGESDKIRTKRYTKERPLYETSGALRLVKSPESTYRLKTSITGREHDTQTVRMRQTAQWDLARGLLVATHVHEALALRGGLFLLHELLRQRALGNEPQGIPDACV